MTSLELLSCVLLIFLSAYLSASEIALFSLSRFQLRFLRENFRPVHRKIKRLLADPGGVLITILVVNEILNISLSSLITNIVNKNHIGTPATFSFIPDWAFETTIGILITTPLVLFFCEATPKVIGVKINQLVATITAGPLIAIYTLFRPIRYILNRVIHLIPTGKGSPVLIENTHHHKHKSKKKHKILKESDFLLMVEEGHKEGAIRESEMDLIRNVFELDKTTVQDVATPVSQILSLPANTTLKGALGAVRGQNYSRIPIIGSSSHRKEIVGILYSKDLLRSKLSHESASITVATLMRKPYYVSSTLHLNDLFRKFKQNKIHMAIVKNHLGDVTGVVTMSDVLDALFEDLFDDAV
ncbi:MAG: CNNM domain-containing protein [Bdellovibrionia bacterium]